jgi:mannosyltransferase OCH1-like enzyme
MLIHQIWIGKYAPPTFWMDSVRQFAEQYGHTYMFWDEVKLSNIQLQNREYYEFLYKEKRFAGASDILRYEILYQYGGIYIDADTVILKPTEFHDFLRKHDGTFFIGCETDNCNLYANGTIGIPKGHVFMKEVINSLNEHWRGHSGEPDWKLTGPKFFTKIMQEKKPEFTSIPRKVFYPIKWHNIKDPWLHTKIAVPEESLLFQYGYTTNRYHEIFAKRNILALVLMILSLAVLTITLGKSQYFPYYVGAFFIVAIAIKYNFIH